MKANHKLVSAEVVTLNTVSLKDDFITTAPPFIAPTAVSCRVSVLPWQSRLDARTGNQHDDSGMCGRLDMSLSRPTNDRIMMMEKEKTPPDFDWPCPPAVIEVEVSDALLAVNYISGFLRPIQENLLLCLHCRTFTSPLSSLWKRCQGSSWLWLLAPLYVRTGVCASNAGRSLFYSVPQAAQLVPRHCPQVCSVFIRSLKIGSGNSVICACSCCSNQFSDSWPLVPAWEIWPVVLGSKHYSKLLDTANLPPVTSVFVIRKQELRRCFYTTLLFPFLSLLDLPAWSRHEGLFSASVYSGFQRV